MEIDSWLLTWATYGTWLPGDERGFVGNVLEEPANDAIHSANVVRAVDASRRVSFNMRIKNAEQASAPWHFGSPICSSRQREETRRRQSAGFIQQTDIDK